METQRTPEKPDQDSLEMARMENGDVGKRPFEMQGGSGEGCNMHILEVLDGDPFNMPPLRLYKEEAGSVTLAPRLPQTLANIGDYQDSPPFMDPLPCHDLFETYQQDPISLSSPMQETVANSWDHQYSQLSMVMSRYWDLFDDTFHIARERNKIPICAGKPVEQNRTADVHNLSERPRRDRIDEIKSLQEFIPNSSQSFEVEQLGMVHQSSSKVGNMEVMNYGVNENGDHSWSGTSEAQVEDTDSEPENASEGYQSEANTSLEPDGADDTFIFQATSSNSVNTQVFKERILTAICDLDDRTFGQNSKLQVNVLQCQYMVNTIVTSKCYLMGETCATLADPICKELFRIVKKADLIVQECSDEPLNLKSILVEMDNICAFVAVIVDWQSCTRMLRKDMDNWTWASVHSRLEQLKAQDIQKNKESWDLHIAELRQLMSNAGGSRTGERSNLADYLQWRVQNVMNAYDLPQGLLPWCVLASDPEAKRGEFLGMGTYGSVSQCTWLGMACAEKSFNPFLCEKQERDFEKEVGVMVRLNHPHVVQLICCHQASTQCSIVMELMPTNLERYIAERKVSHKPFTPQAAVDVMLQIASAMEYLHGQGVVHRDLKPNNILVSPNTNPELSADGYVEVKLADFGLAKTKVNTSSSMLHSRIFAAAPWRAPEAFEDYEGHQRRFSAKRADVYSFAIVCSQILSGKLYPFGHTPVRLLERISSPQNERPFLPSNSNYPAQLLSLIEQCWAPDPRMRPNFSTIWSSLQEIRVSLLVCKSDVEDTDSEPENASEGYQSEANTSLEPDGADDTFIFQATSSNSVNTQVFKERILTAICDLDDRTFGQNSKLQVNVLQCQYMVNTIVTSKCYLMGETCATLADPICKELFRIVKKADLIVQECSDEPLNLKSILVEMDNICAFVAVIVDWQSCTRMLRKDMDNWTWASVHSRLEQLKAQDIQKNKESWDLHIAELRQLMSNAGGSRTGERSNLADYLQWRVQNVMNAYDLPQGLLPWCVLASDPEAKRGEFLGMGTYGSVSQCTWLGMACAEKSFNPFLCEKQERDFEKEVGVMVRLNHPHVVQLICCHQASTQCSIVMELMPTNLERYIAERKVSHKPFTPQAAVDVMLQIASAMEYLHGQGVVHRDLKPNNILVSPNTNPELSADGYVEVKLADFGLAMTKINTCSSMLHSQICVAAPWRAPEAFEDYEGHQRRFSAKRADVYSFAIVCSQILSGKLHPFSYAPVRLLERISSPQNERPFLPSNSNYPAQLLSLIEQCWAPDPRMRPNFSTIWSSLQEIRVSLLVCKWDVN